MENGRTRLCAFAKRFDDLSVDDVWHFIRNVYAERQAGFLEPNEVRRLMDFKSGFGNIHARHAYYKQAYCRPLWRALRETYRRFGENLRVLDVGCGVGTQSILFSLLPAQVLGIDINTEQLATARKRQEYYSRLLTSTKQIEFRETDIKACDFSELGEFQVAYSHGCIGRILHADEVFERLSPALSPSGLIIMKNSNPDSIWQKIAGRKGDLSGHKEYLAAARRSGFRPIFVKGTTAIPRALWFAGGLTRTPDYLLRPLFALQIHLEMIFEKSDG